MLSTHVQVDNQKAVLASDRAKPNVTANLRFYFEFVTSMFLKREDLVPWDDLKWYRKLTRQIISHPWFNRFIITIVLVNCVIMSMYHYNMSTTFGNSLEVQSILRCLCHCSTPSQTSVLPHHAPCLFCGSTISLSPCNVALLQSCS